MSASRAAATSGIRAAAYGSRVQVYTEALSMDSQRDEQRSRGGERKKSTRRQRVVLRPEELHQQLEHVCTKPLQTAIFTASINGALQESDGPKRGKPATGYAFTLIYDAELHSSMLNMLKPDPTPWSHHSYRLRPRASPLTLPQGLAPARPCSTRAPLQLERPPRQPPSAPRSPPEPAPSALAPQRSSLRPVPLSRRLPVTRRRPAEPSLALAGRTLE